MEKSQLPQQSLKCVHWIIYRRGGTKRKKPKKKSDRVEPLVRKITLDSAFSFYDITRRRIETRRRRERQQPTTTQNSIGEEEYIGGRRRRVDDELESKVKAANKSYDSQGSGSELTVSKRFFLRVTLGAHNVEIEKTFSSFIIQLKPLSLAPRRQQHEKKNSRKTRNRWR